MKLRKKAKKRLKNLLLITVILIIFIVSYKTLHKEKDKPSSKIETLMKENNIDKKNYGKTLEYVLLNNIYDEKYLNEFTKCHGEDYEEVKCTLEHIKNTINEKNNCTYIDINNENLKVHFDDFCS